MADATLSRTQFVTIPLDEYNRLLTAEVELKIIYGKVDPCTYYDIGSFVTLMRDLLHPVCHPEIQEDSDAE
jgi:hypothetical protein